MYSACLFCHARLGANGAIEPFPIGRRLAFDPARGRLWVVCVRCGQWNLTPIEERWEAVEECERNFRGTLTRLSTANVGLARLHDGTELVRVGAPLRPEFAAWRYGDQLGRQHLGAPLAIGVAALRAIYERQRVVCRVPAGEGALALVRGRHVRETRVLTGGPWGARWGLSVSHGDDGATVVLTGPEALRIAGVLLARINYAGASPAGVRLAVALLERHGDAARCFQYAAERPEYERHRLARLPLEVRLALEMAAHEGTERAALEGELGALERAWEEAEVIAAIADDLLLPPSIFEFIRRHRAG